MCLSFKSSGKQIQYKTNRYLFTSDQHVVPDVRRVEVHTIIARISSCQISDLHSFSFFFPNYINLVLE